MLKKLMILGALLTAGVAQAFVPQAGTWVVTSENNGQPGRGFGLDVQDTTLVMQMYAYDSSGYPTFYLTAGRYANERYTGVLNKYRNGRYFGSGARNGTPDGDAGVVSMRFISGTKGYITFPNEPEKEINRFSFAYNTEPNSLRGFWLLSAVNDQSAANDRVDFFKLERIQGRSDYGTGIINSTDNQYACENLVRGPNAGNVMCLQFNTYGQSIRTSFFQYSVNDGEGFAGRSSTEAYDMLIARRITNSAADRTGLVLKNQEAAQPLDADLVKNAMNEAASQAAGGTKASAATE